MPANAIQWDFVSKYKQIKGESEKRRNVEEILEHTQQPEAL